jgi:hypothetical protein
MPSVPHHLTSSVVMCTFNGARFVEEQIRSIVKQTCPPTEIVVFDDRSTDATIAILERIAASTDVPIRITVNATRKGSTENFLAAIAASASDVLFLSDQDDVWCANKVEAMLGLFARNPELGLIVSDASAVDENLQPLGYTVLESLPITPAERRQVERGTGSHLVLKRPFGTGSSMAFRSNLKPPILMLDRPAGLIHDSWILTVAAAYSTIAVMNEVLNLYRQHAAQQVGAPPKWRANSGSVSAATQPSTDRSTHRNQLKIYQQLRRSLVENGKFNTHRAFSATLDEAIAHAERRLALPAPFLKRGIVVLHELASRRYSRYSSGLKSAGKDLLRL